MAESATVQRLVQQAGNGRRLLDHPFYQRWQAGELTTGDLADYAVQYRHFEQVLPGFLGRIEGAITDSRAARMVAMNLADEAGGDPTHLQLFDRFAAAVGATPGPADPATERLVETYWALAAAGPAEGLAGLAAYEDQAAEVATTKAAGLRNHYHLPTEAVEFWDVHAELDSDHAVWAAQAIGWLGAERSAISDAARRATEAWWAFLDHREAAFVAKR